MAQINPFDELGRILSAGGENRIITAAMGMVPFPVLLNFTRERYPSLSESESVILAELASQAVAAGGQLTSDIVDLESAYDSAPQNPVLGGYGELGIRYRVTAVSTTFDPESQQEKQMRHVFNLGVATSFQELYEQMERVINDILENSPEKLDGIHDDGRLETAMTITSIQRRW